MRTFNPPEHIIFGDRLPRIERGSEGSRQYVFSTTNYNLFLKESDLDDNGTFTIGSLLKADKNCPYCLRWTNITLPECELTCKTCSLLTEKYADMQIAKAYLQETPKIYRCKLLSTLLSCTTTSAQRRFAEVYYQLAISWLGFSDDVISRFCDMHKTYGGFSKSFDKSHTDSWSEAVENEKIIRRILDSLEAPALIPQVWLNRAYEPGQYFKLEEEGTNCVDFIFIYKNRLHVVRIDASLQCARRSSSGIMGTTEETYSTHLLHRLSEKEILNASESELPDLLSETLGISLGYSKPGLPSPQSHRNVHVASK